jgi:hypothetical protein
MWNSFVLADNHETRKKDQWLNARELGRVLQSICAGSWVVE